MRLEILIMILGISLLLPTVAFAQTESESIQQETKRHPLQINAELWKMNIITDEKFLEILKNSLSNDTIQLPTDNEMMATELIVGPHNPGIFQIDNSKTVTITWEHPTISGTSTIQGKKICGEINSAHDDRCGKKIKIETGATLVSVIDPTGNIEEHQILSNSLTLPITEDTVTGTYQINGKIKGYDVTIPSFSIVHIMPDTTMPQWFTSATNWYVDEKISFETYLTAIKQLSEIKRFQFIIPDETSLVEDANFESVVQYNITQEDIDLLFEHPWKIINEEYTLNNTDVKSSRIILKDAARVFEPVYNKHKVPAIIAEIHQFNEKSEQENFWYLPQYEKMIWEIASKTGKSEYTGQCFFERSIQGGVSGCMYENLIIQVTVFDPYIEHFAYRDENSRLEFEPSIKITNQILEKVNSDKGVDFQNNLYKILQQEEPMIQKLDVKEINQPDIQIKKSEQNADPEISQKSGINQFSCNKDDFGMVTVAGEFFNGVGFADVVNISISLTDKNQNNIINDSNKFHNVEKFDSRKFLVYIKTNENFYDCTVKISSDDKRIEFESSLRK